MADFKYTTVFGKIEGLLERIRTTGVPPKANADWLKALGYTSSNDKSLPPVLKALGLIDGQNVPTEKWRAYRGAEHRQVLGDAVRSAYSDLFNLYPDACFRSDAELESYFRTRTDGGDQVVKKIVGTFKALCANADIGGSVSLDAVPQGQPDRSVTNRTERQANQTKGNISPSLHIDIQIHISPESSSEQVDQIFKSMAEHIYGARE